MAKKIAMFTQIKESTAEFDRNNQFWSAKNAKSSLARAGLIQLLEYLT